MSFSHVPDEPINESHVQESAANKKKIWTTPVIRLIDLNSAENGCRSGPPDGIQQHNRS